MDSTVDYPPNFVHPLLQRNSAKQATPDQTIPNRGCGELSQTACEPDSSSAVNEKPKFDHCDER